MLTNPRSRSALAAALRSEPGASLGEVFTFLSSLYFRGKLAYARRFGLAFGELPGAFVITPGRGLRHDSERIRLPDLVAMGSVAIDAANAEFTEPLRRDAEALAALAPPACEFVLLGSIATDKYVRTLLAVLGERLVFPEAFVGRGDMSRGGLLLRSAREGELLRTVPVASSARRGARAPRIGSLTAPRGKRP